MNPLDFVALLDLTNISQLEGSIGKMGIDLFGNMNFAGLILLFMFVAFLAVGGYSFETTILALFALSVVMEMGGLIPNWFVLINLMFAGTIIYLVLHKIMNRGG